MSEEKVLPGGWEWTNLSAVAAINPGLSLSALSDETHVSFVPMASVEAGTGHMDGSTQRPLGEVRRGYTAFQEGDVLFAKITPCMENGKAAVARSLISGIGLGSTEFHVLRPAPDVDAQLLYYYVSQESFRQTARASMTGTAGQLRVPAAHLADAPYPLPPPSEQQRIVAAIEQQFTRLDAGVAALKSAQIRLKRYRASVLKAAVEGKLTEAWRDEHHDTEPASVLLQRILAERRARWEADLRAKGKDPAKVRYEEPAAPDTTDLPELPEGWCYTKLEPLLSRIRKGMTTGPFGTLLKKEDYQPEGVPVLGIENIGRAEFIPGTKVYITAEKAEQLSNYDVQPGDILISRSGTVGEVCVIPQGLDDARISTNVMRVSLAENGMFPKYFCLLFIGSPYVLSQVAELCKGSLRDFLNQHILSTIVFPFPPLAEQTQIIAEIEKRLSVVDELEEGLEANLKRAERLRQSILREAFAGRLVTQDPNDEPASVLLERIRRERAGNGRATRHDKDRVPVLIPNRVEQVEARQVGLWGEEGE